MFNDVVDLILGAQRKVEDLLREVRNIEADRGRALAELAALLVAHAEAEEKEVYPILRYKADDVTEKEVEVEHSSEEHDEGHEALLAVMEV